MLDEDILPAWSCPVFGGKLPYWLALLAEAQRRPPVAVAEFANAEALIYRNAVVVVDRNGHAHADFSVGDFPGPVRARVSAQQALDPQTVEPYEADSAVLIADHFPAPNIGHLLFDQITRIALYQRLDIPVERSLVIGPEPVLPAQREILRRAGVVTYLGTERIARVRARRLWVSGNCRDLRYPSHLGAPWAVEYSRRILGGRGTKGWRRLYISRADVGARGVVNEAEVMALLEPHGFEAILPARLPYDAQIAAFKQASHIAGPHGAGLTHMLVLPPGAHVLEMFHPLSGNRAYATLAAATDLR